MSSATGVGAFLAMKNFSNLGTVVSGETLTPFSSALIQDTLNPSPTDTVTIALTPASQQTFGTLSLPNNTSALVQNADGTWTLGPADVATLSNEVDQLVYATNYGTLANPVNASFVVTLTDPMLNQDGKMITASNHSDVTFTNAATSADPFVIPLPSMPANFSITDVTSGAVGTTAGQPYSGPVSGIDQQFITDTSGGLAILANVPNTFIHTGSGEDAIQFIDGTNVGDGGTGSNFLTGGAGRDTFFVDDRNPTADTWSSIVNFHAGDDATIWGLTPQDFQIKHLDNQGAVNAKGLTFSITAPNHPNANLTLAGYTSDDLSNRKLTVSFGRTADQTGLPGSNYMLIHANG